MVPQEDGQKCRVAGTRVSVSCRRPTLTASALIWHWTPPPSCERGPEPQGKLVMPPTQPPPPPPPTRADWQEVRTTWTCPSSPIWWIWTCWALARA